METMGLWLSEAMLAALPEVWLKDLLLRIIPALGPTPPLSWVEEALQCDSRFVHLGHQLPLPAAPPLPSLPPGQLPCSSLLWPSQASALPVFFFITGPFSPCFAPYMSPKPLFDEFNHTK